MDELFKNELESCVRCGKCRSVCPVFQVTLKESYVARGRLFTIKKLNDAPSKKYLKFLSACLLCGACESKCSNKVKVTDLVRKARTHHKDNLLKRAILGHVLPKQERIKVLAKVGGSFISIFGKEIPSDSGLRFRLGFAGALKGRRVQKLPEKDLLSTHGTLTRKSDTAIFTGCVANYILPEIGESALKVLRFLGVNADIPQKQACCGLMAFGAGDKKSVESSLEKFVCLFSKYEEVIVVCASCATMLKNNLTDFSAKAEKLAGRIHEIHSYLLMKDFKPAKSLPKEFSPIAYHKPCHFRFAMAEKSPEKLLEKIPEIKIVNIEDGCCGFGGSFTLSNPKISARIGKLRADEIADSKARVVTTSCSGCLMGIYDGVKNIRPLPKVVHPITLLAKTV